MCLMEVLLRTREIKKVTLAQRLFRNTGWFLMQPDSLGGCEKWLMGIRCNLISSGQKAHLNSHTVRLQLRWK